MQTPTETHFVEPLPMDPEEVTGPNCFRFEFGEQMEASANKSDLLMQLASMHLPLEHAHM